MEKKEGRLPKKRGRPEKLNKQKVEKVEDELLTNSTDGDSGTLVQPSLPSTNASPTGPSSTPLSAHMVTTRQTRSAKALADKQLELNAPSRIPFQNDDGQNTSKNSTLSLVKQILFGSNGLDTPSTSPTEALPSKCSSKTQVLHSQHENISDAVSSERESHPKNVLDLKKFTSDLLAQVQQNELHIQATSSSCSNEIMVDNNLPGRDANVVSNISPTVPFFDKQSPKYNNELISNPTDLFTNVNGYKVKLELAPLLTAIFTKYGDIAKESTFSMKSRSVLLELVCSIYKRLEASMFKEVTPLEIQSMVGQIRDLELVNVEVGWLCKRLDRIAKAMEMYDGVLSLEDVEERTGLVIDEKKRKVETYEKELEELKERVKQKKGELAMVMAVADEIKELYGGSLVHGLV